MFQLEKHFFGEAEEWVITHTSGTYIKCIPAFGANIRGLCLFKNGKAIQVLDGFQTFEQLQQNEKSRGIFLIPFPNRIRDGKFLFEGKDYQLPINKPRENNAIHGFIWDRNFSVTETVLNENNATLKMSYQYPGDHEGFPFSFLTTLTFQFTLDELKITIDIVNNGTDKMPLGVGWHPYFTFHQKANDLLLQIPKSKKLETDERMIPTGITEDFAVFGSFEKINETAFDTCFNFSDRKNIYETKISDSENTITVWQDSSFCYLQVYIPPNRNSIALEPMTCAANAFNTKEDLLTLYPNEKFSGSFGVRLG